MEMQELLDHLKELCAGKTAEEIEQEIGETSYGERIPDASLLAKYLVSLVGEPEEEPVDGPDADTADEEDQ